MFSMSEKEVKAYKEKYPYGTRVVCNYCADPYRPVPQGTKGTVRNVDDIGTIHVNWDNGQGLGMVPGEDSISIIQEG